MRIFFRRKKIFAILNNVCYIFVVSTILRFNRVSKVSTGKIILAVMATCMTLEFFTASVAKCLAMDKFRETLSVSMLVPDRLVPAVAVLLICAEGAVAIGMCFGHLRLWAIRLSLVLSSSFVAYGAWRIANGIATPCSCFGLILNLSPTGSFMLATVTFMLSSTLNICKLTLLK
jgi:hypothetical protein